MKKRKKPKWPLDPLDEDTEHGVDMRKASSLWNPLGKGLFIIVLAVMVLAWYLVAWSGKQWP